MKFEQFITESTPKNVIKAIKEAKEVCEKHRKVEDRIEVLRKMGYEIENCPMGSGGVGNIRRMRTREWRIQIGYGKGRYNYADAIRIK